MLAGDFNGWDYNILPMMKDNTGTWKIKISLVPGRYEYQFLVEGHAKNDPNAEKRVANPFADQNCVKINI